MPFNQYSEYGGQLAIHRRYEDLTDGSEVVQWAHRQAARELPIGSVYEIRLRIPENYGRRRSIGWYYAPGLENSPWMERLQANQPGGYIFFGMYRVEGQEEVSVGPTEDIILGLRDGRGERT